VEEVEAAVWRGSLGGTSSLGKNGAIARRMASWLWHQLKSGS